MRQVHTRQNPKIPQTRASDTEVCGVWGWRLLSHARTALMSGACSGEADCLCVRVPPAQHAGSLRMSRWQLVYLHCTVLVFSPWVKVTWQLQLAFTYYFHGLYTTVNNNIDPENGGVVHHLCHVNCLNKVTT